MMSKWIKKMGLLAFCILAYALPVYAAQESISLEAKDNEATVSLELPSADNVQREEIHSMQLSLKVEPAQGQNSLDYVSFAFDEGITSVVKEYRYHKETGALNIYISGQQNLFAGEKLAIGKVALDAKAPEGTSVSVCAVGDSLYTVNAAYYMQKRDVAVPEAVRLEIDARKTTQPVIKKDQKAKVKPSALTFTVGGKARTLKVSNAKGKVKFSVDKPKTASVSGRGKVTPKSAGKATITITAAGDKDYKKKVLKVKVTVKPKKPARVMNVQVTAGKKKRTMKVTWEKMAASGYQIRYSTKSSMKQSVTVDVPKVTAKMKTVKKVPSKKRVYVQVRAYKTKKGVTNYGKWSKPAVSGEKIK